MMATMFRNNNMRAYDGPYMPKNEVGYLCSTQEARALSVAEIDGRAIKEIKKTVGHTGGYDFIELLPGVHVIKVVGGTDSGRLSVFTGMSSWRLTIEGEWLLKFTVEPGHLYLIDLEIREKEKKYKEKVDVDKHEGSYYSISSVFVREGKTKEIISEVVEKKELKEKSPHLGLNFLNDDF